MDDLKARIEEFTKAKGSATNFTKKNFILASANSAVELLDDCLKRIEELERGLAEEQSENTRLLETVLMLREQQKEDFDRASKLEAAIRKHRDQKGDDRCFLDDFELYAVLGEPMPDPQYCPPEEMLENCKRFIQSRQGAGEYISSQRRIEKLESELQQSANRIDQLIAAVRGFEEEKRRVWP